jgi:hypothetical protein
MMEDPVRERFVSVFRGNVQKEAVRAYTCVFSREKAAGSGLKTKKRIASERNSLPD